MKPTLTLHDVKLGSHCLTEAKPEQMDSIFLMGEDIWASGETRSKYLEECRQSQKYKKGTWSVLVDSQGRPISSLISYQLDPIAERNVIGIGSLATSPSYRRKGFATIAIQALIEAFQRQQAIDVFLLFADVYPEFYQRVGFVVLPSPLQMVSGSVAMLRASSDVQAKVFSSNHRFGYF